jgi:hypothetical protein
MKNNNLESTTILTHWIGAPKSDAAHACAHFQGINPEPINTDAGNMRGKKIKSPP